MSENPFERTALWHRAYQAQMQLMQDAIMGISGLKNLYVTDKISLEAFEERASMLIEREVATL